VCVRLSILWVALSAVLATRLCLGQGAHDPVGALAARVEAGKEKLNFDAKRGYLPALLKALHIPESSQVLAFSKTSSQADCTGPQTPRAMYFSDTVSIAWVLNSKEIDMASVDPQNGSVFFTIQQSNSNAARFTRRDDCLGCHESRKTLDVPAWLVRSVYTDSRGAPLANVDGFINGHNSPLEIRWGGWYVTGAPSTLQHLGNRFTPDSEHLEQGTVLAASQIKALRRSFLAEGHLADTSDLVALLVLEHQVRMQALLTLAGRETRELSPDLHGSDPGISDAAQNRLRHIGDMLVAYMLFRDEAPLPMPFSLTARSKFVREFERAGPHDPKGRSLRQLDLNHRLFRFPCSYLVYTPSFDVLPAEMKDYIWGRLLQILHGTDQTAPYLSLDPESRQAILEILSATRPEFHQRLYLALDQ